MEGLVANKYQKYWNAGIFIFIIMIVAIYLLESRNITQEIYNDELNSKYSGKIIKKYIDKYEHNQPILVTQKDSLIFVFRECYEKVSIGDSIVKNKGNFEFLIYKSSGIVVVNIKDNLIIPKE